MWGRLKWGLVLVLILVLVFGSIGHTFADSGRMVKVLIGLKQSAMISDISLVRAKGGSVEHSFHLIPVIVARVPSQVLPILRALKQFRYVELDGEVKTMDDTLPWGIDRIDAELVHPYNQGNGVKVAVIDTGIDLDHEDLNVAGNVTFVSGTASGDDDNGHGTHVAGIIAALDNGADIVGVAPVVEPYAVKVLDSRGSGSWSAVIAGIEWAVDNGMDVINMSLGSSRGSYSLEDACNVAYNAGIVVVAAAGNSGYSWTTRYDRVVYPAKYDSVIAVAATDSSDNRAGFSSTGPAVELAAPGADIYSTYPGDHYQEMSGTSMASPHVAGVAALVIASGITDSNSNGRINDEVRLRLQNTADDIGNTGRDVEFGYGMVDADEAAPPGANQPPTADAGEDQNVLVDTLVTLDGSGSDDPESDPLDYLWTQKPGGPYNVTLSPDNTVQQPAFTPNQVGTFTFELVVNDGEFDSLPDEVVITVKAQNNPPPAPVVDVTPDSPLTGDNLVCNITTPSVDVDGDPVTYSYQWFKDTVPQPALTTNTVSSIHTAKGEVWKCEVTPNDGTVDGSVGSDQVTIGNSPPAADAGSDQYVLVDTLVTLNGAGSDDPDNDSLGYLWTQQPGGPYNVTLSPGNTAKKPTFTPTQTGTYTFQLEVDDGSATDTDTVTINVAEVPDTVMHIKRINMSLVQRSGGWRTFARARVIIIDKYGNRVEGAVVYGHWEGATSDTDSKTTNSAGKVSVKSNSLRLPPSGTTFTFVVDNVVKSGWTYDAAANKETRDSVSVP